MNGTKRQNLTKQDIADAYKALRAEGRRRVSGLDIREKTLGGSLTTIYKHLREIEAAEAAAFGTTGAAAPGTDANQAKMPPVPPARLEAGNTFLKMFWESAFTEAKKLFDGHESEFAATLAEHEKTIQAKQDENEKLLMELEKSEKAQSAVEGEAGILRESSLKLTGELEALREQFAQREKEFKSKTESQERELFEIRREANALREKMSVVGELTALKEQFSVREKELKERISAQDEEIAALRRDAIELRERATRAETQLTLLGSTNTPKSK